MYPDSEVTYTSYSHGVMDEWVATNAGIEGVAGGKPVKVQIPELVWRAVSESFGPVKQLGTMTEEEKSRKYLECAVEPESRVVTLKVMSNGDRRMTDVVLCDDESPEPGVAVVDEWLKPLRVGLLGENLNVGISG